MDTLIQDLRYAIRMLVKSPSFSVAAIIILALLAIALSLGLAGMSTMIGERVFPELPLWKQSLWGAVCLSLACALPFVGWFLLFPYVGFVSIGSVILGFLQKT